MPDRHHLHRRWLTLLTEERARRSGIPTDEEATAWLIETLDQMGARLAMAPDYVPPTPEESAETEREMEAFFKRLARDRR